MYIFSGFITGLLVGLTGVGGGALMTPLLLLVFGISPNTAIGTDLVFATITKTFGASSHWRNNLIDWQVLKRLWLGSIPSSLIAIFLIHYNLIDLNLSSMNGLIGIMVLISALGMLIQDRLSSLGKRTRITSPEFFKALQPGLTVLAGIILGFLVTTTSIGAGALGAIMLAYLYPLRLTPARLVATDIVHAIPVTLLAGSGHLIMGNIDYKLLNFLLLGSIPGILIGVKLSPIMPRLLLKNLIAVVLVAVGIKLIFASH